MVALHACQSSIFIDLYLTYALCLLDAHLTDLLFASYSHHRSSLGFGVITSTCVEDGFRGVDRKFFVPRVSSFFVYYASLICLLSSMAEKLT